MQTEQKTAAAVRVVQLVRACQKSRVRRILAPGGMAEKLHRVQDDISKTTMIALFAIEVHGTIVLRNIDYGVHHRPPDPEDHMVESASPLHETPSELAQGAINTEDSLEYITEQVPDQVTEVSTQVENVSYDTNDVVHEISSSIETVTITEPEAGLSLIASIGEINILSNRSGALDIARGSTNTAEVHEIEVDKDENATKGKVSTEEYEYDLEKILDEQETHDLYCPNCKSCITRRVILKNRKGYGEQQKRQHADESLDQESPEVFGCLSCFTFFIPTGCGFNIFRIFERRDANQQVEVQHPAASQETSEHCGSWLLSCFQTVDSPKKSTVADSQKEPLLSGPQSTDNTISVEDSASSSQSLSPLVAGSSSTVQTTTGKNEEEIKQPFSEYHGTASSSVTVHTSSSSQSETGLFTQTGQVVTEQRGGAHQEQIPPSKPADDMINGIHLGHKQDIQGNTTGASGNNSFFNQPFFNPELEVQAKVLPGVDNLTGEKPNPVIPQPSQLPHIVVPVLSERPVRPAPSDQRDEWDILKAIVYGGLVESITSLSVVSAAAASGAKTRFKKFSLSELEEATHKFLKDNIIGQGAFATVYKGALLDGLVVAIKKIQYPYQLSMKDICDKLAHVSKLEHKNIVQLIGYGHGVLETIERFQDKKR
ncbi:hypothetical protein PVAP13_8NG295500 [Panicum virgatum]|uniref:Protein kinase domain-containing protein n=1 Tax=Panicum virgatum TaxID=38727 RepID=A0A8T0PEV4_PANVG|nr:hypothetical protein PVAP13_8NG295500 [Panicum virgatum]